MARKKPKNPPQRPVKPVLPFRVLWDVVAETAPLEPGREREVALEAAHGLVDRLPTTYLVAALPVLGRYAEGQEPTRGA